MDYFSVLSRILNSLSATNNLPSLSVPQSSTLGVAISHLANSNLANSTEETTIDDIINTVTNNAADELYIADMQLVHDMANRYATQIIDAFNVLSSVKATVEQVHTDIDNSIKAMSSTSPNLVALRVADKADWVPAFTMVPWDDLEVVGTPMYVLNELKKVSPYINTTDPKEITFSMNFANIVNKNVLFYMEAHAAEIKTIQVGAEVIERIVNAVHEKCDIPNTDIEDIVNVMFNNGGALTRFNELMLLRYSTFDDNSFDVGSILTMMSYVRNFNKAVKPLLEVVAVDGILTDTDQFTLGVNGDFVNSLLMYGYVYLASRRATLRDKIILSNTVLNPDAVKDFTTKGYTLYDIACFIHSGGTNPINVGIRLDNVEASIESIKTDMQNDIASKQRMAEVELKQIRYKSFNSVLNEYVRNHVTNPRISDTEMYIRHMSDDYTVLNADLVSSIYRVIINIEYSGTFIETLYEKLGDAYITALGSSQNINDTIKSEAELSVIVNTIVDHMLTSIVAVN